MSVELIIGFVVAVIVIGVVYQLYVSVVEARNYGQAALSNIDIQLRRRLDTVPNLIKMARKFMTHEQDLLKDITELRSQAASVSCKDAPSEGFALNGKLGGKVNSLMVAVENYPDLKSDAVLQDAMKDLSLIEEDIAATRRLYNGAVLDFNNKFDIFPYSVIASMMNMERMVSYEDQEPDKIKQSVDASDYL